MCEEIKIKNCKATHGKYNLDNENIVIQVDVELDAKTITKNIGNDVENLLSAAPELLESLELALPILQQYTAETTGLPVKGKAEEAIKKAKGEQA